MRSLVTVILLYSSFTLLSCNNTPTTPEDNTPPGKRNYIWNVDSVDYDSLPGMIELNSIWGSSPTDVWGAGFTSDVRNCLWHYDGTKWRRAVYNTPITVYGNGSKSVGGVWGTAQNDVWAFGGRIYSNPETTAPFIMHFDGIKWTEVLGDINQMPDGYTDIYPIRKDHFWISSSNHVSEYKDGIWKKYTLQDNYFIQSIGGAGTSVYLTAYPIGADSLYIMKLIDNNFVIIDQTTLYTEGKFGYSGLLFANNKMYTFMRSIFTRKSNDGNLIEDVWIKEFTMGSGGFSNSFARNDKDIWAIGINSLPHHFNGENWSPIIIGELLQDSYFIGIWGNGEEIFISDTENGIIYHGR